MRLHIKLLNLIVYAVLAGVFAKGFLVSAGKSVEIFKVFVVNGAIGEVDSAIKDLGGTGFGSKSSGSSRSWMSSLKDLVLGGAGSNSREDDSAIKAILVRHNYPLGSDPDATNDAVRRELLRDFYQAARIVLRTQDDSWRTDVARGFRALDSTRVTTGRSTLQHAKKELDRERSYGGGGTAKQQMYTRLRQINVSMDDCRAALFDLTVAKGFPERELEAAIDR